LYRENFVVEGFHRTTMNAIIHPRPMMLLSVMYLLALLGGSESFSLQSMRSSLSSIRTTRLASNFPQLDKATVHTTTTSRRYRGDSGGLVPFTLLAASASDDDTASSEESKDETAASTPVGDKAVAKNEDDNASETPSSAKNALLTVPLFIKFFIVLVIKAVTDLVVYPVLLLWRLAHNVKRRILGLFRKGGKTKTNGEAAS
jgi:hypothetical protein